MPRKSSIKFKRRPKAKSQAEQGAKAAQKDYVAFLEKADSESRKK